MREIIREEMDILRNQLARLIEERKLLEIKVDQLQKIAYELQEFIFDFEDKYL